MANRSFSERLNHELDNIGLPFPEEERVEAFAKLIHTKKFQAKSILHGELIPSAEVLATIARELDVNVEWLIGKTNAHH